MHSIAPQEVVALNPVSCGAVLWRRRGDLRVTVIVKATFALRHDADAELVSPLPLEHADRYLDDDPTQSLAAARELSPYLASAGVVLTGHACAPPGEVVTSLAARLAVIRDETPLLDKTIHVFGDVAPGSEAPAPFARMPIVYERAYGGPDVPANPVGVSELRGRRPNLLYPENPYRPAGFGPISHRWPLRRRLFAGYDLEVTAAPEGEVLELGEGFDFRALNPAPFDQQIAFLHGNEWIFLDGLSAERARVKTRLPDVRARAGFRIEAGAGAGRIEPVGLVADLLVLDADRQLGAITWRGNFTIESLDLLPAVRIFAGLEMPHLAIPWPEPDDDAAPISVTSMMRTLPTSSAARRAAVLPFQAPIETAPDLYPPSSRSNALPLPGAPWSEPPNDARTAPPAGAAREPPGGLQVTQEIVIPEAASRLLAALPFGEGEPAAPAMILPAVSGPAVSAPAMILPEVSTPEASAPEASAPEVSPPEVSVPEVSPPEASASEATAPAEVAELPASAPSQAASPGASASERERVQAELAAGHDLEGADLSGVDLSGLDFSGRSLRRCALRGAGLKDAKLEEATLEEADLRGADLSGAVLTRARADRADLRGANLERANLEQARFLGASFAGAVLRNAKADLGDFTAARFDHADLGGASFRKAHLVEAVLAHAQLDMTDLRSANLERANLHEAARRKAKIAGAKMNEISELPPPGPDGPVGRSG